MLCVSLNTQLFLAALLSIAVKKTIEISPASPPITPHSEIIAICEGDYKYIECPKGQVITIVDAMYGRLDSRICIRPHEKANTNMPDTKCSSKDSLNVVNDKCNHKENCTVLSSNSWYGDPCVGIFKYLLIEYHCDPASPPPTPITPHSEIIAICEGDYKYIECPKGQVITIVDAMYGRLDSRICIRPHEKANKNMPDTKCSSKDSLNVVNDKCNHKENCTVLSSNSWYGDPCVGIFKYLLIEYHCDPAPPPPPLITPHSAIIAICEGDNTYIACPRGQSIIIVDAMYGRLDSRICIRPHEKVNTNMPDTKCSSKNSLKVVSDKCNHKENCTVLSSNSWYGDPCVRIFKYLLIEYHCHPGYVGWIPPSNSVGTHQWVPSTGGQVPPDAVQAGRDKDGGLIYVGRAFHEGDILPAKVCPRHGCAFIAYNGMEIAKMQYEVLCSNHVAWKFASYGEYPPEAIRIGNTKEGEPLFCGRTVVDGVMTPGKVHPSHRCLYVSFSGREQSFPEYEILVLN